MLLTFKDLRLLIESFLHTCFYLSLKRCEALEDAKGSLNLCPRRLSKAIVLGCEESAKNQNKHFSITLRARSNIVSIIYA